MHILFDSLSSQAQVHRRLHIRMNTLLGAIRSEGWTDSFSRDPITAGQLDACDVLAILTREHPNFHDATNPNDDLKAFEYTDAEKSAIHSFVDKGRGLLLISNQGPNPATAATPSVTPSTTGLSRRSSRSFSTPRTSSSRAKS